MELNIQEVLVAHIETRAVLEFWATWSLINMMAGDTVREMAAEQYTASYDRLYAVKEHDIEGEHCYFYLFLQIVNEKYVIELTIRLELVHSFLILYCELFDT